MTQFNVVSWRQSFYVEDKALRHRWEYHFWQSHFMMKTLTKYLGSLKQSMTLCGLIGSKKNNLLMLKIWNDDKNISAGLRMLSTNTKQNDKNLSNIPTKLLSSLHENGFNLPWLQLWHLSVIHEHTKAWACSCLIKVIRVCFCSF